MDVVELSKLFSDAVYLVVIMVSILIVPGMLMGLIISIFQAATQINEQTLSFLPKLIITLLMLVFAGSFLMTSLTDLFDRLFINIPVWIG
ncbi:flagellar biosynthetic protein FliQ [Paraferrimonas sp. SM1919]|uniref:flagellar biosynthetic protein FliQ n=1 Tax=Paraferrimonas sp. SM1919 TaxID=2662263 RepID=UPI0013D77C03|nr:flagellar biosynthetic protein FliQ [Paraferrimonas sp. SM1919]